jgi:hypothetical protein
LQNGIELPTTDTPDVDDAGVEEISINQTEPLPSANISDHDQNHITHNHEADVEASQDNGIFMFTTYYTFKAKQYVWSQSILLTHLLTFSEQIRTKKPK